MGIGRERSAAPAKDKAKDAASNPQGGAQITQASGHASSTAIGGPIPVDPTTALLRCVHLAAGQVEHASQQVARVPAERTFEDTKNGARLNPWARVQAETMERLARFSKMAIDAGVAERQVELAERWGAQIATVLRQILDDLALTDEQRARAPEVVRSHLLALEKGYAPTT
jgi:hypothetical protein